MAVYAVVDPAIGETVKDCPTIADKEPKGVIVGLLELSALTTARSSLLWNVAVSPTLGLDRRSSGRLVCHGHARGDRRWLTACVRYHAYHAATNGPGAGITVIQACDAWALNSRSASQRKQQ